MTFFFESETHKELRKMFVEKYASKFFILPEKDLGGNRPDVRIYDNGEIFYVDFYTESSMGYDADRIFRKIFSYSKHSNPVIIVVKKESFDSFLKILEIKFSTIDRSSGRFYWDDRNVVLCPLEGGGKVELVGI